MAKYLAAGADVFIQRQHECGKDVPPYAIAVVADPAFWIDCRKTIASAKERAKVLGLRVIANKR